MDTLIDIEVLRELNPLDQLDADGLAELGRKIHVEELPPKRHLFVRGQQDHWVYYLLDGHLVLSQHDKVLKRLDGAEAAACQPLDPHQPRQLTATTRTAVRFIRIDRDLLELLLSKDKLPVYSVEELEAGSDETEQRLLHHIVHDFFADKLVIPSLPELALRISRAVDDPDMNVAQLAQMIQYDAGIAARLIQVTNSPLYHIDPPVTTCRGAVEHLGFQLVRNLVLSYALQQLFHASTTVLKRSMIHVWRRTSQVAAMSYLLARQTRHLNADRAFLAGVLHGIGALPIISHAGHYPALATNPIQLDLAIEKLTNPVSAMILRKWGFGQDILTAALESDVWLRDPSRHADYCDVVLLARLHQSIGTPQQTGLPPIDTVPALRKIAGGKLGPQGSIQILENARDELQELEALLVVH